MGCGGAVNRLLVEKIEEGIVQNSWPGWLADQENEHEYEYEHEHEYEYEYE
jgi:hypothetical protein